jgi:His-Xaa-Ser repeat protein HxsA
MSRKITDRRYLIPSLLAAGFNLNGPAQAAFTKATVTGTDDPNAGKLFRIFTQDHVVTLAQHRSHSSHSSHASHSSGGYGGGGHASHMSHTSHRSSSGSYDSGSYDPTPAYTPPAPPPAPPTPPPSPVSLFGSQKATPPPKADASLPALSGRTKRFASIVRRAQIALLAQGAYQGPINGVVGPTTRAAIRKFQTSRSLSVTGTLTPQTLDALMVSSD